MKKRTIFLLWACIGIALFACRKNEQNERADSLAPEAGILPSPILTVLSV